MYYIYKENGNSWNFVRGEHEKDDAIEYAEKQKKAWEDIGFRSPTYKVLYNSTGTEVFRTA